MVKKLEQGEALYFVAVVPAGVLGEELMDLKRHFRERYGAARALNSPPHITLHMPFRWKGNREAELKAALKNVAALNGAFSITIDGFGAFPPRVIYARPLESAPLRALQRAVGRELRRSLNIFNADYQDRGFHPHITLAFRDLKKPRFHEAWNEFENKPFERHFEVTSLVLLKHNGQSWDAFAEFSLAGLTSADTGERPSEETE